MSLPILGKILGHAQPATAARRSPWPRAGGSRAFGCRLSQVYGFAKAAGGHVKIYSEVGVGTTVKLYLPRSSDQPINSDLDAETTSLPTSRHETILVVEDDEDVLAVAAENLSGLGYQVVTAVNAARALEILKGDRPVDLLLSDVIMPGGTAPRS